MFSSISWSEYLTFIIVSSLIYYFFVLFTYYRQDLLQATSSNRKSPDSRMNFTYVPLKEPSEDAHEDYQPKPANSIVDSFMDEVRAYLEEAGRNEVSKEIVLQSLSMIVGKYSDIGRSVNRDFLDSFLIHEVNMNCAVLLSEDDLRSIWKEA